MMDLKKNISTTTLLASSVAGIVGSGWLLGPLACAKMAGPAAVLTWLIGGVLMMGIALCFILLTRVYPIVGGSVQFFFHTYGEFAGFSFAWITWLAWVAVCPIETMALVQYSSNYLPQLMTTGVETHLTWLGVGVSSIIMIVITWINQSGLHWYKQCNAIILFFKLLIPIATVIILMSTHFSSHHFVSGHGFMPHGWSSVFAALPMAGVIYAFIGFNPAIQLAAETKNPRRSIPVAIIGSLVFCMVLYTLIQVAFIGSLPTSFLSGGWAKISFDGDTGPFAGLLTALGVFWFVKALYLDAAISPFGTGLVQANATGRLTLAMTMQGYFPQCLVKLNDKGVPQRSLWVNCFIGILFFMPFPSWQHMVGFLVSCLVMGYVVGPMALCVVSDSQQSIIGLPSCVSHGVAMMGFIVCNCMIYWSGWDTVSQVGVVFAIGYCVLGCRWLYHYFQSKTTTLHMKRGCWVVVYIILLELMSYYGSFGGIGLIPAGLDAVVVALMSVFVFFMAKYLVLVTASSFSDV